MHPNSPTKTISTIEEVIHLKGEEWRRPLEYTRSIFPINILSDKNLIRLTKGRCTIPHLELMVQILYLDHKERPIGINGIDQFFYVVDRSGFNLFDWLEAISFFHNWLSASHRKTPFLKMLGYLQCCEDSPENKEITHHFIDLIKEMLEQHGFIG